MQGYTQYIIYRRLDSDKTRMLSANLSHNEHQKDIWYIKMILTKSILGR